MPLEKRASQRYPDPSTVVLGASRDLTGRLVDLSVAGLRAHFEEADGLTPEQEYALRVQPCKAPDMRPFSLFVRLVWSERHGGGLEAGFRIVASPSGKEFQHYLDFLAFRKGGEDHAD